MKKLYLIFSLLSFSFLRAGGSETAEMQKALKEHAHTYLTQLPAELRHELVTLRGASELSEAIISQDAVKVRDIVRAAPHLATAAMLKLAVTAPPPPKPQGFIPWLKSQFTQLKQESQEAARKETERISFHPDLIRSYIVRFLLKAAGPRIAMEKDNEGKTILHWAVKNGDYSLIEEVVTNSPPFLLFVRDNDGKRARHYTNNPFIEGIFNAVETMLLKQLPELLLIANDPRLLEPLLKDPLEKGPFEAALKAIKEAFKEQQLHF